MPSAVRVASPELIGRTRELRSTFDALRCMRDGRPGLVTVCGPAGIGKISFVTALTDQLRSGGALVMIGGCLDVGPGAPPYTPLIAAFRSVNPPSVQLLDALTSALSMRRSRLF